MNWTLENGKKKKKKIGSDFDSLGPKSISWVLPFLDVRHCYKLLLYGISRKTNSPNSRKWQKIPSFWARFRMVGPKFGLRKHFHKNMVLPVTRYPGHLSSCTISEKTNNPVLRRLSEGHTDGLMGRQTRVTS